MIWYTCTRRPVQILQLRGTCHAQEHEETCKISCLYVCLQQPDPANMNLIRKRVPLTLPITKLSIEEDMDYLGIDCKYFPLRNPHFKVTYFIGIPVPKARIERVAVRRKQCLDFLETNSKTGLRGQKLSKLIDHSIKPTAQPTSKQPILNSWGALLITGTNWQKLENYPAQETTWIKYSARMISRETELLLTDISKSSTFSI